jgi:hypothetical protein
MIMIVRGDIIGPVWIAMQKELYNVTVVAAQNGLIVAHATDQKR